MTRKNSIQTYIDGYATLYKDTPSRNSFGAKINEGDLELLFSDCPFAEMSQRQSDLEFAEQSGFSISRKIRLQYCNWLQRNVKYKCVIDKMLYDVSYFDSTNEATYLYLEYIREVTES